MNEFLSEAIGTFILILFGLGVNAGSSLNNSFSNKISNSWVMGTFGWGLAVTLGVYAAKFSGAHINPAVTIGLLTSGEISSNKAIVYIFGQITGAFIGCIIIFLHYSRLLSVPVSKFNTFSFILFLFSFSNANINFCKSFIIEIK